MPRSAAHAGARRDRSGGWAGADVPGLHRPGPSLRALWGGWGMRPRLLDLVCWAGGAATGYHRAGFDVVGVDNRPRSNYPFDLVQADALEYLAAHGREFDAIHASPPCQRFSVANYIHGRQDHPHLIA